MGWLLTPRSILQELQKKIIMKLGNNGKEEKQEVLRRVKPVLNCALSVCVHLKGKRLLWRLSTEVQAAGISVLKDNNQGGREARVWKTGED